MELRLVGPVDAALDGRPAPLGRRRERLLLALLALLACWRCWLAGVAGLLALLALEPGRVVPVDRLIDLLWAGSRGWIPPGTICRCMRAVCGSGCAR